MVIQQRYRLGESLSYSPLGDVRLAEDLHAKCLVVVHVLNRHLTIEPEVLAAFRQDMLALLDLDAPTLAPWQDIFYHDNRLYLVQPYLPGQTLAEYMAEHDPLSPAQFQNWALSLTHTLDLTHQETIIHGDIRPENIFVVPKSARFPVPIPAPVVELVDVVDHTTPADGETPAEEEAWKRVTQEHLSVNPEADQVDAEWDLEDLAAATIPTRPAEPHPADTPGEFRLVIANFGLYHLFENRRLATTSARLNLSNATSPQRWQGQPPTISDDIWNLGVLFFWLTSGQWPFTAPSDAAIMNRVLHQATPNLRGRVPRGFVAIIERCLEKDPWRRYRSLGGVAADLERGTVRWPGRRHGLMPRERSPWVSWGLFVLFLLIILGIPAGGGAAFVARNQPTATPIVIAGVIFSPTPTTTNTPIVVPFDPSPQGTLTATYTPSVTWTPLVITNTPSLTYTPSDTPTATATATITPSLTPTASASPTATPSITPTVTQLPTITPSPSITATSTATSTATVAPATTTATSTASPTATATATPTANATATANRAEFLTRAAMIEGTQFALETRLAPLPAEAQTATAIARTPLAATLAADRPARTGASALPLCEPGEDLLTYTTFAANEALPGSIPEGALVERIDGDTALHLTRQGTWLLPVAPENVRLRFDLLAPRSATPPLTVSFVPLPGSPLADNAATGWRLSWQMGNTAESTGLILQQLRNGQPVEVSALVAVPFDTWITVDMGFSPVDEGRSVFSLTAYTPDGPSTTLWTLDNALLTPLSVVAFDATIDSAPWLDNLQICGGTVADGSRPTAEGNAP